MSNDQTSVSVQSVRWSELFTRENLPKVLVLGLAIWLHAANSMLAATTLPSAIEDIGGFNLISWAYALYLLGSIVAGASIGLIVSKYGLKKTMLFAALIYAVGGVVCAMAISMPMLLVGRTIQGLGGGALVALVFVCQERFFGNRLVPKVVGLMSIVWMMSSFSGPLIGGAFATFNVWRLAFLIFSIKAVLLMLCIHVLFGRQAQTLALSQARIPVTRLLFLVIAVLSISWAGAYFHPIGSPLMIFVGCFAIGLFLRRDKRRKC